MGVVWKFLLGSAAALSLILVIGSVLGASGDNPAPRETILIRDATSPGSPAPDRPAGKPSPSPRVDDDDDDDRDEDDDDSDVEVIEPEPEDVDDDDDGQDDGREDDGQGGADDD